MSSSERERAGERVCGCMCVCICTCVCTCVSVSISEVPLVRTGVFVTWLSKCAYRQHVMAFSAILNLCVCYTEGVCEWVDFFLYAGAFGLISFADIKTKRQLLWGVW